MSYAALYMAGFQVTLHDRFWAITEAFAAQSIETKGLSRFCPVPGVRPTAS
jgi:hypothetical protein